MDAMQQRITETAQQIPGYAGYQAKEQRREADRLVRRQLAAKFDEQRTRLTRVQQKAPLDHIVELERLDQQLLRLIDRLKTAPSGYAGWFDAAQIGEKDLDALTLFDSSLTRGVGRLKTELDRVASAFQANKGIDDAIGACADLLDGLNAQFDQREQFLAMGKKPSPAEVAALQPQSPLSALQTKPAPPADLVALAGLKVNDAVTYGKTDYIVAGKITYTISAGSFWAFWLQDREDKRWLRVGPQGELAICQETDLSVPSPAPETVQRGTQSFTRDLNGTATLVVEGPGGVKRGSATYARYSAGGSRLWLEDYGTETRAMAGDVIELSELKWYRR